MGRLRARGTLVEAGENPWRRKVEKDMEDMAEALGGVWKERWTAAKEGGNNGIVSGGRNLGGSTRVRHGGGGRRRWRLAPRSVQRQQAPAAAAMWGLPAAAASRSRFRSCEPWNLGTPGDQNCWHAPPHPGIQGTWEPRTPDNQNCETPGLTPIEIPLRPHRGRL